jgi:hypothetical protein
MGTIRGAQAALGKNARVHVVWNGMGKGTAAVSISGKETAPLLYTRLNDAGTAFEPERNVITWAAGLDGGSSTAADPLGNVYVTWHAALPGNTNGDAGRALFVARSTDNGKTFERETAALSTPTGACACCGLRAFADNSGAVCISFRAAIEGVNRDELLLVSRQPGAPFEIANAHPWHASTCPMSSASLSGGKGSILAAWETPNQVYYAGVEPKMIVVPLTLLLIILIIYLNTRSAIKTAIVMLAVPFSLVGAIGVLALLNYNLSVAVWVGIIALAGLDAETGVVMLLYLDLAYDQWIRDGKMRTVADLRDAIYHGAVKRVRPKAMTACVIIGGLLPILWSHSTGADVMKRIATPMVGGVVTSTVMELAVCPAIFYLWRSRRLSQPALTA